MRILPILFVLIVHSVFGQEQDNVIQETALNRNYTVFKDSDYGPVNDIAFYYNSDILCVGDSTIEKDRVGPYLVKVNKTTGETESLNCFSNSWSRSYQRMIYSKNQNLILVGYSQESKAAEKKAHILYLDSNWKVLLDTIINEPGEGILTDVKETENKNFVITGHINRQAILIKITGKGHMTTYIKAEEETDSFGKSLIGWDENTVYILGNRGSKKRKELAVWKHSKKNRFVLERFFTDTESEGQFILKDMKRGFFVFTKTEHPQRLTECLKQIKFDRIGAEQWNKINLDMPFNHIATCGIQLLNGHFFLAGQSLEGIQWSNEPRGWTTLFNQGPKSNALDSRTILTKGESQFNAILEENDGTIFLAGYEKIGSKTIGKITCLEAPYNPKCYVRTGVINSSDKVKQPEATAEIRIYSSEPLNKIDFQMTGYKNERTKKLLDYEGEKSGDSIIPLEPENGQYVYKLTKSVSLSRGINYFYFSIKNPCGFVREDFFSFNYEPEPPNLHILSIGIPYHDLKYTANDAQDFVDAMKEMEGENKLYKKVYSEILNTPSKTKGIPVKQAINKFTSNQKIRDTDVAIIFISSHGIIRNIRGDTSYLILTSDFNEDNESLTSVLFEEEIFNPFERLNCRKMIFVDACRRIQGVRSREDEQVDWHIKKGQKNLITLYSSEFGEKSYEDPSWQNGAFTEIILATLNPEKHRGTITKGLKKDIEEVYLDKKLEVKELMYIISTHVPALVKKKTSFNQHPTHYIDREYIDWNFNFYLKN